MAGRAADLGDDAEAGFGGECRGLRRSEVVRCQDARLGERRDAGLRHTQQAGNRPVPDVTQVGDALGHVAAERLEHDADLLDGSRHGGGGPLARLQLRFDAHGQSRVAGHHGAGLEDRTGMVARFGGACVEARCNILQNPTHQVHGRGGIGGGRLIRRRLGRGCHNDEGPDGGSGADADAVEGGVQDVAGHRTTLRRGRGTAVRRGFRGPRPRLHRRRTE